jgi:hypothetical protein
MQHRGPHGIRVSGAMLNPKLPPGLCTGTVTPVTVTPISSNGHRLLPFEKTRQISAYSRQVKP